MYCSFGHHCEVTGSPECENCAVFFLQFYNTIPFIVSFEASVHLYGNPECSGKFSPQFHRPRTSDEIGG
jgi:hypothetical protein